MTSAFSQALSKAISSQGNLSQKVKTLSEVGMDRFYSSISNFMQPEHGVHSLTPYLREQITSAIFNNFQNQLASHSFSIENKIHNAFLVFEFYDSPFIYTYQESHDDCVFTDARVEFVGKIQIICNFGIGQAHNCLIPKQRIILEFLFTEKFVKIMEEKFERLY